MSKLNLTFCTFSDRCLSLFFSIQIFLSLSQSVFLSLTDPSLSYSPISLFLTLSLYLSLYLCQSLSVSTTQSRTPVIILTIADFCRRHQHQSFNQPSLKFKSAFPPFFLNFPPFFENFPPFFEISRHFLKFPAIFYLFCHV